MADNACRVCGKALPRPDGRPGRASVYCSAACRQKAYRTRRAGGGDAVHDLISDIERRVRSLAPDRPEPFYADVRELSSSIGRLRRIARVAADATRSVPAAVTHSVTHSVTPVVTESVTTAVTEPVTPAATEPVTETESVTPEPVTNPLRHGDEIDFAALVEPHRRELQVHCYRMVGSYDDSEDLVQETLLKAWRNREAFEGRSSLRTWLYTIATNTCLDFLRRNERRPQQYAPSPVPPSNEVTAPPFLPWLQPFPDDPEAAAETAETLELVFLAAIQHLPPKQRAVLIMRDVLGWPAADTAAALDLTVASVTSALQRARPALRERLPERRDEWARGTDPSEAERALLDRYMRAAVDGDTDAMTAMLRADVRITMPPNPLWFGGRDAIIGMLSQTFDPSSPAYIGRWRHLPARANGQLALGGYVQRPGTRVYRAQVMDVLRIEDGLIAEITSFEPHLFPAFGLPLTLTD
ncbi:MAG TPA: RNA polymerase subunit sigma-70 [Spirillospora sp.]|nr:RNA polymerase subunit sigma-70 [Spirillospora sp.]